MTSQPAPDSTRRKLGQALAFALSSRRTLSVTLLSFSSGLPLGLVWIAIPDWMATNDVDIRIIGLTSLAHMPWTFKMLWSPLMDRYTPRWLGRRRGWIAFAQIALFVLTLMLAGVGDHPDLPWVVIAFATAIAFASACQDIAFDAYAVDVLLPEEQGLAVGARFGSYRLAMLLAGGFSITLAGWWSWPVVCVLLASIYLPLVLITRRAPEPEVRAVAPRTLREAVWLPFLGFLSRHQALSILSLVVLYKLADNLSQALLRPFLEEMGYDAFSRGIGLATIGFWATFLGTFVGGALTTTWGLGRCLWLFGFLQIFSNIGYILVANSEVSWPLMYGAMIFEHATTGSGMGAFGVLLLRMTQKRFSATQYALFSSLFALPRLLAGPVTGYLVHAFGWTDFFWFTMAAGVPGMVLLARFVPFGVRDPTFEVKELPSREPLTRFGLAVRAALGGLTGAVLALLVMATLSGLSAITDQPGSPFDLVGRMLLLLQPDGVVGVLKLLAALLSASVAALLTAAVFVARHGGGGDIVEG